MIEPEPIEVGEWTLRPPRADDAAWIYDACQDAEIARWTRVPSPYTARDAVEFLQRSATQWADGSGCSFVIAATETGELVGTVALMRFSDGAGATASVAEIGYWLALDGRGRGAATAAVRGISHWAAHRLGLERLEATVAIGNEASEAVLARCGFTCVDRQSSCDTPRGDVPASRWQLVL
ncbi:MAG: GNAT family N-acetyltransferase [Acidimicrobiia bacterium]